VKTRNELNTKRMNLLTDLEIGRINVKFIRYDDSGDNKVF
jgi:hypothetical protein